MVGPEPFQPATPQPRPVAPSALGHAKKPSAPQAPSTPPHVGRATVGSERTFYALTYGFELLRSLMAIVLIAVIVNLFVVTVFRISGESMYPSFEDGQFILVDRLTYLFSPPQRGDVVVLEFPGDPTERKFIKRVVGLPGETVEIRDNTVFVNNAELEESYIPAFTPTQPNLSKTLRADEVFVMGDNRPNSNDSRFFGPLPKNLIIGVSRATLSGEAYGFIAQPAF